MMSLSRGDWAGMLLAVSDRALALTTPLVALAVGTAIVFGGSWQVTKKATTLIPHAISALHGFQLLRLQKADQ